MVNKILGDDNPSLKVKYIEVEQCPDYDLMYIYDSKDYCLGDIYIQNTLRSIAEFHMYPQFNYHKNGIWIMKCK
jgi:hypothetical protein